MELQRRRKLFTVDQYERMADAGVFHPDDRLELIRGEILQMSPPGPEHIGRMILLTRLLVKHLDGIALPSPQNPVRIFPHSMPQPDIAMLRPRDDHYVTSVPTPGDILLVVEIADSSVSTDRRVKSRLYAECGIPEYWIVNLRARLVEMHSDPTPESYALVRKLRGDDRIPSRVFPALELTVVDILGDPPSRAGVVDPSP